MIKQSEHYERKLNWWLEAGTEQCNFCLRWYHCEAGCYCLECDHPICPACAVSSRIGAGVLCPGCTEDGLEI